VLGKLLERISKFHPKKVLDQRKQAKMQWLQDPGETNRDNLNDVRHEATNSKNKTLETCIVE
jgi:hypothetical protein